MKKLIFSFVTLLTFSGIFAYESFDEIVIKNCFHGVHHLNPSNTSKYVKNPYVSDELWNELKPYFLPENHPIKTTLDALFSMQRLLSSRKTLKHAGFNVLKHPQREIVIARHPALKGYLVKAYLDNKRIDEWRWWKKRIDGARQIQECIDRYNFNALMKTPRKWIYPLPSEPSPPNVPGIQRKNFILVVEDMNILSKKENKKAFKDRMTTPLLNAIFIVLSENLLVDSIFAPNIPYSRDGKIAFIDTEHFNNVTRSMKYWKLLKYLSPEMREYWKKIIPSPEQNPPAPPI